MDQATLDTYKLIPSPAMDQLISLEDRGMWIYRQSIGGVIYRIFKKTKEYMIVSPKDRSMDIVKIVAEQFVLPGRSTMHG